MHEEVITTLTNNGYKVHSRIINTVDYGIPQWRNRLWIVAIRDDFTGEECPTWEWPQDIVPWSLQTLLLAKNRDSSEHKTLPQGKGAAKNVTLAKQNADSVGTWMWTG